MKTSLIHYRVADFLRQHAPFQSVPLDDVLPLAQSGRVMFHSEGEMVHWRGQPFKPWIWVIQQGSVELLDESSGTPVIRDLLSAGDMLGVERFTDAPGYTYSARTTCDVIVYALDGEALTDLRRRAPAVDRYLRALLPASPGASLPAPSGSFLKAEMRRDLLRARVVECHPSTPLREVAAAMLAVHSPAAVVLNDAGSPTGVISERTLRSAWAQGVSADTPAGSVIERSFPVVAATLPLDQMMLQLVRAEESFAVVTEDGSSTSLVQGVLTEATFQCFIGVNPVTLIRLVRESGSVEELSALRERVYAFVEQELQDPSAVEWFSEFLCEFLASLTKRLIAITAGQLEKSSWSRPDAAWCWMFVGAAGRAESLAPVAPSGAIVCEDSATDRDLIWFRELEQRVAKSYLACGLCQPTSPAAPPAQSLEAWNAVFFGLLSDPLLNALDENRGLFDFRAVAGDATLVDALRQKIRSVLPEASSAVSLLANDCLNRFPPLTFFQNLVIELDGTRREDLDLAATAIDPLADVGRVFAMAAGDPVPTGTVARLEKAATSIPERAALLLEAADAARVLLLQQCRNGIKDRSDGAVVYPPLLSRYEQLLLKSAFRTVARVMELTYERAFGAGQS